MQISQVLLLLQWSFSLHMSAKNKYIMFPLNNTLTCCLEQIITKGKKLLSLQNKSLSECNSTLNSLMGDTLSQICQSVKCTTVDLTRLRWYEDLDVSVCEGKTTEIVSLPTPTHTHIFWHHWSIELSKTKPHKANWTFFHIFYFTLNFLTLRESCGNLPTTHSFHPKWRLFGRNVTQLADTQKTYNLRGESSFINKERLLRESRWIKYTWRNSLCSSNKKNEPAARTRSAVFTHETLNCHGSVCASQTTTNMNLFSVKRWSSLSVTGAHHWSKAGEDL